MKRTRHATLIAAAIMCAAVITGCTPAIADQPVDSPRGYEFRDISDYFAPRDPSGATLIVERQAAREAEEAAQAEREAAEAAEAVEAEYEYQEVYYEPYSAPQSVMGNPDGLNSYDGVFEHDGRTETFYSGDNAAYRDQLWVDDDGFYRSDEGYYAVAVSEYETNPATGEAYKNGDTFEGSQGTCVVVDCGASDGVTDYCVSGWC